MIDYVAFDMPSFRPGKNVESLIILGKPDFLWKAGSKLTWI
jgi:hypothetical protein